MAISSKSVISQLTGTGTTTVYTVPSATEVTIISMIISNISGVTASIQVFLDKGGGGPDVQIFTNTSVADDETIYIDSRVNLEATDLLRIATDQTDVDYAVSYIEKT